MPKHSQSGHLSVHSKILATNNDKCPQQQHPVHILTITIVSYGQGIKKLGNKICACV